MLDDTNNGNERDLPTEEGLAFDEPKEGFEEDRGKLPGDRDGGRWVQDRWR